jgi:hypothetical protein
MHSVAVMVAPAAAPLVSLVEVADPVVGEHVVMV